MAYVDEHARLRRAGRPFVPSPSSSREGVPSYLHDKESMQERIIRISADLRDIERFWNIPGDETRYAVLREYLESQLAALPKASFQSFSQDEKVDYLLLKNYLTRAKRNLDLDCISEREFAPFIEPFSGPIREWCQTRQRQQAEDRFEPKEVADSLTKARDAVEASIEHVTDHRHEYSQATGSRAVRRIGELRKLLSETYNFYSGYHPLFDYWVAAPYAALNTALQSLEDHIRNVIIGQKDKMIIGEPIGFDRLVVELEAEMIPYLPGELLRIADAEYTWYENEMSCAAAQLGCEEWRDALEYVKNIYEPPETYPTFVRSLVTEGASYVRKHNLVTVPRLAEESITVHRIPPERQLVSPFFLGGPRLQISYPRADMEHGDKLMSLRGNNWHFGRATAFHEMIPGHRLQFFVSERSRPYRAHLFDTPFYVEGWALYWEMVLWHRRDFFVTPEDKIGSLFWLMHRCARITFSLKFHLGEMTAAECVDLLVERVGHERSTAEGEVRRSLNGSYPPLYQAGYMLGALQLMQLRKEAVDSGLWAEKAFHDAILKANVMPIELLRALLLGEELHEDFKSSWKFYELLKRKLDQIW